jgi:hypothetical protein
MEDGERPFVERIAAAQVSIMRFVLALRSPELQGINGVRRKQGVTRHGHCPT